MKMSIETMTAKLDQYLNQLHCFKSKEYVSQFWKTDKEFEAALVLYESVGLKFLRSDGVLYHVRFQMPFLIA